jgi:hypothetical protein
MWVTVKIRKQMRKAPARGRGFGVCASLKLQYFLLVFPYCFKDSRLHITTMPSIFRAEVIESSWVVGILEDLGP